MANAAIKPSNRVRRNAQARSIAETTERGDAYENADDRTPDSRLPKEFYAELTKRSDVREILKQLAES